MPHRTYLLACGAFATSDTEPPPDFVSVFDVSAEDAALIEAGADLSVVDGRLVITPLPVIVPEYAPEPDPEASPA